MVFSWVAAQVLGAGTAVVVQALMAAAVAVGTPLWIRGSAEPA